MSILDFEVPFEGMFKGAPSELAPQLEALLQSTNVGGAHANFAWTRHTQKEIFGLTEGEMNTLFQCGYQAACAGDFNGAQALFMRLCELDPFDPRYPAAMGMSLQLAGSVGPAARSYLLSLALNASQLELYVRLGECLLTAGEPDRARDTLETAIAMSEAGDEEVREQAGKLLARCGRK